MTQLLRRPFAQALCSLAVFASTPLASANHPEGPSPEAAIERARAEIEEIAALVPADRTYDNTVLAIDDVIGRLYRGARWAAFMENVHPDPEVRARGEAVAQEMSNFWVELNLHEGLYAAVRTVAASRPELSPVHQRFLDETLLDFRRAGMELAPEKRQELKELEFELNEVAQKFRNNLRDDESYVTFTEEELAGVPADHLQRLDQYDGLYAIALKPTLTRPISAKCEVPLTRKKLSFAYGRRGGRRNVDVLEQMIQLRHRKAQLLGYPTTAAYELERRMAKTPETVESFYSELRPKLRRKAQADWDEMVAAKREHTGDPAAELDGWDALFYKNYLLKHRYAVDTSVLQEYFPLERVYKGLFSITQRLFDVEYRKVDDGGESRGRGPWHADVELYEVWDNRTNALLGEFYTDLFPRTGKYNHAAQFPIFLRSQREGEALQTPVVALVCNFTKPTDEKPSLLTHSEVETFFHEFGHCLHSILSESPIASLAGTNVARDFVEAPSQMLENWVWDRETLGTFAGHFETGEPIPESLLDGMLAAKNLGSGNSYEYQVYLGMMDMRFHTASNGVVDTTEVAHRTQRECRLTPPLEGTFGQGAFGHMSGYQAGYYGYLWSLVYAQDMFTRFEELGMLNPEAGRYYRDRILSKGNTVDALELVKEYLGREPNSDAFLRHLGLGTSASDS